MRARAPAATASATALRAALPVLLVLLAGCSGGDGAGPPPSTSASATPVPTTPPIDPTPPPGAFVVDLLPDFAFEECRGISVQSARPIEDVQALLPEGFTAAPFAVDGAGLVGLDLYACGNLTTPTARVGAIAFGQVYTHVLRPVERLAGAPEAEVHEYAFRLLAGDDIGARLWPAAGYETRNGTADVTIGPAITGLPFDTGARLGDGTVGALYRLVASGSPATPVSAPGTFARYTALSDGSVLVWTGAYGPATGVDGQGTFDVPGDDPFAGFEQANSVPGTAHLYESISVGGQDLRRFF